MTNNELVYACLNDLDIPFTVHNHPPVNSIEEAEHYMETILEGVRCKNLFLRNHKGDKHFLVIADHSKQIDLKILAQELNEKRLGFASEERLYKYLSLMPGCVTPFGLINDVNKEVVVVIDEELKRNDKIKFHPNINTETLTLGYSNFEKFLEHSGNTYIYLNLQLVEQASI